MSKQIDLEARYCAQNGRPLPVVLTRGEGLCAGNDAGLPDVLTKIDKTRLAP